MTNGLTPYDKKSYRESKKRRKQALAAAQTGKIQPLRKNKKRLVIALCVAAAVALAVVCIYFAANVKGSDSSATSTIQQESEDSELLFVVNRSNPLESDYVPSLSSYNEFQVNSLMYESLVDMVDDAQAQGITLRLTKAYVSFADQQEQYEQTLAQLLSSPDYTEVRAEAEAQRLVPKGGCSEFQTGLLVEFDISDTASAADLERNCVNFGFIQRYREDKEDITGVAQSSSIYRYVGSKNALNLRSYDMCLEEYCEYLDTQQAN
jgi:D-alanyl-D-alanine carboxypeptidase